MLGRSQVSRLGLNLKSAFPFRDGTVAVLSRPLHGYWDSPEIASDSYDAFQRRAFRADTPAIHLSSSL